MGATSAAAADRVTANVLLGLALVTAVCLLATRLMRRWNQPPVIAEILAGLALGPIALGYLPGNLPERLFPLDIRPFLTVLANVGLVLFMFVVGFEIDLPAIRRMRGSAVSVAATSVLLPFGIGFGLALLVDLGAGATSHPAAGRMVQALFIGTAFSATAFPVLARILDDTALKQLRIRNLALSAAAAGDVVSWAMLAVVVALSRQAGPRSTVLLVVEFAALVLALRYLARPLITFLLKENQDGTAASRALGVVLVGVFLCSWSTTAMHIHPIFGAFAFGFACPRGVVSGAIPDLGAKLTDASRILMPMFFVLTGLSMNIHSFGVRELWVTLLITVMASVGKVLGVYISGRLCRLSSQDSWGLGLLMNTRGLTELVILNVGRASGVLSARMFTILAVMAITTTLVTGPVMGRLYSDLTIRDAPGRRFGRRRRRARTTRPAAAKPPVTPRGKQLPVDAAPAQDLRSPLAPAHSPALEQPPER
ncbi:MAG TPA: cation:proton antiporter [Jatrophihabitans sp.]|nr:cation:proton antiporter [Jatrophihabitans sp.]